MVYSTEWHLPGTHPESVTQLYVPLTMHRLVMQHLHAWVAFQVTEGSTAPMDFLGPLPLSMDENGVENCYILVFSDYFSKWRKVVTLPDQKTPILRAVQKPVNSFTASNRRHILQPWKSPRRIQGMARMLRCCRVEGGISVGGRGNADHYTSRCYSCELTAGTTGDTEASPQCRMARDFDPRKKMQQTLLSHGSRQERVKKAPAAPRQLRLRCAKSDQVSGRPCCLCLLKLVRLS